MFQSLCGATETTAPSPDKIRANGQRSLRLITWVPAYSTPAHPFDKFLFKLSQWNRSRGVVLPPIMSDPCGSFSHKPIRL